LHGNFSAANHPLAEKEQDLCWLSVGTKCNSDLQNT